VSKPKWQVGDTVRRGGIMPADDARVFTVTSIRTIHLYDLKTPGEWQTGVGEEFLQCLIEPFLDRSPAQRDSKHG